MICESAGTSGAVFFASGKVLSNDISSVMQYSVTPGEQALWRIVSKTNETNIQTSGT